MKTLKPVFSASVLALLFIYNGHAHAQEKPNFVLMLMDNLGWGNVGTYGGHSNGSTGTENLTWALPAVTYEILKFQDTLIKEPLVPFPAPEPFNPESVSK